MELRSQIHRRGAHASIVAAVFLASLALGPLAGFAAANDRAVAAPAAAPAARSAAETCTRAWRLTLAGTPDQIGPAGLACAGCDHITTGGDRMAANRPVDVGTVSVSVADGSVFTVTLPAARPGSSTHQTVVNLCSPPPYTVRYIGMPAPYWLCPNSPQEVRITQADFDRHSATVPGKGRRYEHDWFYWRCAAEGAVICSIKCWISCVGPGQTGCWRDCPDQPCS